MKLDQCSIIGAIALQQSKAAFSRANVILRIGQGLDRYLEATTYLDGDEVVGKSLTRDDLLGLIEGGQAMQFYEPVSAKSGAALWILRPNFLGREGALEELRKSGTMLCEYTLLSDKSFGCLVREHKQTLELRDRWAAAADVVALKEARANRWDNARAAASQAMVTERAMSPARIAMLSLACSRQGNAVRASGYIAMARNSRGADFERQVREHLAELERSLSQPVVDESPGTLVGMVEALAGKPAGPLRRQDLFQRSRTSMSRGLVRLEAEKLRESSKSN